MPGLEEDAGQATEQTDAVMAALEQQLSGAETSPNEVDALTDGFHDAAMGVTDATVLEAANNNYYPSEDKPNEDETSGAEVIDFPSAMPIGPESAGANGTEGLDMRLAS